MKLPLSVTATLLVLALGGCASPEGITPPQGADGRYWIVMGDAPVFLPAEVKVPRGATVVWSNNGTSLHDVSGYVGDPPEEDQPSFHTGYGVHLGPGQQFNHTFERRGTFTVWCHTHHEQGMKGLVHVV